MKNQSQLPERERERERGYLWFCGFVRERSKGRYERGG